jgi:hypothetical protein
LKNIGLSQILNTVDANRTKVEKIIKMLLEEVLIMAWEDWSQEVRELCITVISDLGLEKEIHKGKNY